MYTYIIYVYMYIHTYTYKYMCQAKENAPRVNNPEEKRGASQMKTLVTAEREGGRGKATVGSPMANGPNAGQGRGVVVAKEEYKRREKEGEGNLWANAARADDLRERGGAEVVQEEQQVGAAKEEEKMRMEEEEMAAEVCGEGGVEEGKKKEEETEEAGIYAHEREEEEVCRVLLCLCLCLRRCWCRCQGL